ncbi:DUF5615 family PIN-like protein [Dyadobacter chenwenxiniae]|uniref:DUF5615 family PIN-like protein n=1 Tax=Dyadobacter chenwenxiniae TaxID=2906456 RepID=UPI0035B5E1AD
MGLRKEHNLVIVTKDTDFYHRCLLDNEPVKVIYLKLGNLLIRDLHLFFQQNWDDHNSSSRREDDHRYAHWDGYYWDLKSCKFPGIIFMLQHEM